MSAKGQTVGARLDDRIHAALTEAENDPRTQAAIDELQGLIRAEYPTASFDIAHGKEPPGLYLIATIDEDDVDDASRLYIDRLVDMQVEEELPLYVSVERPRPWAFSAGRREEMAAEAWEPVAHG